MAANTDAIQQRVTAIKSAAYECICESVDGVGHNQLHNAAQLQLVVTSTTDIDDVV